MSRYGEPDYEEDFPNQGALWAHSANLALTGKRGKKALAELREALLHLPEKRLIERALCTVDAEKRRPEPIHRPDGRVLDYYVRDFEEIVADQGEGVCAVGAYLWWQEVKAGKDPREAFAALPTLPDTEADIHETAYEGQKAGLTYSLAWELAYRNDEAFEGAPAVAAIGYGLPQTLVNVTLGAMLGSAAVTLFLLVRELLDG